MLMLLDCKNVVYFLGIMGPAISDYYKRLILLSVIQLSGGHFVSKILQLFSTVMIWLVKITLEVCRIR